MHNWQTYNFSKYFQEKHFNEDRLQNMATTDTMVNVMKEMTKVLKLNEANLDMKNIQKTMGEFMMQMEKQEIMNGIRKLQPFMIN